MYNMLFAFEISLLAFYAIPNIAKISVERLKQLLPHDYCQKLHCDHDACVFWDSHRPGYTFYLLKLSIRVLCLEDVDGRGDAAFPASCIAFFLLRCKPQSEQFSIF